MGFYSGVNVVIADTCGVTRFNEEIILSKNTFS